MRPDTVANPGQTPWVWDEAWLHTYTEAARLAYADRAQYLADPDFVAAPGSDWRSLIAPAYVAQRAQLIGPRRMANAPAGLPGAAPLALAPMAAGTARGNEANVPLARAVVGGLISSTCLTLFLVPILYTLLVRKNPAIDPRLEEELS